MQAAPVVCMAAATRGGTSQRGPTAGKPFVPLRRPPGRFQRLRVGAKEPRTAADDSDFEARLAALKKAKGETPYGAGRKSSKKLSEDSSADGSKPMRQQYDFTAETLYFESGPHVGDVAVNVALGVTAVWLPLSLAAVGRALFVKYRFTDQRLSCITTAPWKSEQLDAAYQEVRSVVSIGRGVGLWGDMVVTLNDGSKVEMRAVPRYKELEQYILQRRAELTGSDGTAAAANAPAGKGFA